MRQSLEEARKKRERETPFARTNTQYDSTSTHLLVAAVAVIAITALGSLLLRHRATVEWRISR